MQSVGRFGGTGHQRTTHWKPCEQQDLLELAQADAGSMHGFLIGKSCTTLTCELLKEGDENCHHQLRPVLSGQDVFPRVLYLHSDSRVLKATAL